MKAIVTTYYQDPSHGWLKVPKKILVKLGIEKQISSYSYMKGEYAYLEEDADVSLFSKSLPNWEEWRNKCKHSHTNNRSRIRNYSPYEIYDESAAKKVVDFLLDMFDGNHYTAINARRQIKSANLSTLRFWNKKYNLNYVL